MQVEISARCERPAGGSWPTSGRLAVKTLQAAGQELTLGYEFGTGTAAEAAVSHKILAGSWAASIDR